MTAEDTPDSATTGPVAVTDADAVRADWMGVLARSDAGALAEKMATLGAPPAFQWLRRPEFGAVMTRGRAGGTGRVFSLGEMTVTRCALRLSERPEIAGHAYVQGRDAGKAEHAALADAMLQTPDLADAVRAAVVEPLRAEEAARRLRIRRKSGASKVDFFTMVRAEG